MSTHLLSFGAGAGPPPLLAVLRPLHLCSRGRGPNLDLQLQLRPAHRTQVILPAISGLISVLRIRAPDPGSCTFLTPGSGMGKKIHISDPGLGITIQDYFSASISFNILGLNYLSSLLRIRCLFEPGSGMENSNSGSGINIPDPSQRFFFTQHLISFNTCPFVPRCTYLRFC